MAASAGSVTSEVAGSGQPKTTEARSPKGKKKKGLIGRFKDTLSLKKSPSRLSSSTSQPEGLSDPKPVQVSSSQFPKLYSPEESADIIMTKVLPYVKFFSVYINTLNNRGLSSAIEGAISPRDYVNQVLKGSNRDLEEHIGAMIDNQTFLRWPQWVRDLEKTPDTLNKIHQMNEEDLSDEDLGLLQTVYENIPADQLEKIETFQLGNISTSSSTDSYSQ